MHGSDVTVTLPNPLSVLFPGWLALGGRVRDGLVVGTSLLWAVVCLYFLSAALWRPWAHRRPA